MKSPEEIFCDLRASISHNENIIYPDMPPFSPFTRHPEYFLKDTNKKDNAVYDTVRNSFILLGLDKEHLGTSLWNPFIDIIKPGDTVVIKPNFVVSSHAEDGDLFSIITHPAVIRTIVDYSYIALSGKGRIIIADAPQMDCNFKELLKKTGLEIIQRLYKDERDFDLEIMDLRSFWSDMRNSRKGSYTTNRHKLPGDPLGGVRVNLGKESLFYGVKNYERFYGADYDRKETIAHHHDAVQEYLVSKTILSADVVISVPKLKIHKKVGITLNTKGLVGVTVDKNYLVHYTLGTPTEGGDQFPEGLLDAKEKTKIKLQRWAYDALLSRKNRVGDLLYEAAVTLGRLFLKPLGFKLNKEKLIMDAGNWHGNDSAWRMSIDLLKICMYADKDGCMHEAVQRRIISIVDGIVGGEKNGPLVPTRKQCGVIVAGYNPCAVDLICARLMGFDYRKLKTLQYIVEKPGLFKVDIHKIEVAGNEDFTSLFDETNKKPYLSFSPHPGWKGHIEI